MAEPSWPGDELAGVEQAEDSPERPPVRICESTADRAVFIESANADGWIASDITVEVTR